MDFKGHELWHYLDTVSRFPADSGAYMQYHKISFERKNNKLVNVFINGEALDNHKTYRMSINSFNASGGDGYPVLTGLAGFVNTDEIDSHALKRFFTEHSPIDATQYAPN
jgi:5'-nucleotidase / UDP-sugar diphosphatase